MHNGASRPPYEPTGSETAIARDVPFAHSSDSVGMHTSSRTTALLLRGNGAVRFEVKGDSGY